MASEGIKVTAFAGQGDVRRFVKKVRPAFLASAASLYDDPKDREDAQVMWLEEPLTGQAKSFFNRLLRPSRIRGRNHLPPSSTNSQETVAVRIQL